MDSLSQFLVTAAITGVSLVIFGYIFYYLHPEESDE